MQVKLLRVLQDREICMVGSSRIRIVDVRILAATNRDLLSSVKKGVFRVYARWDWTGPWRKWRWSIFATSLPAWTAKRGVRRRFSGSAERPYAKN